MQITDLATSGSLPALEATLQFAARRQAVIAHNIANLDTPNFQQVDVSPAAFQAQLRSAIEARAKDGGGSSGTLRLAETSEVRQRADGTLDITPTTASSNILFHDRNNRDLETLMKDQTENLLTFRFAAEMLRSRFGLIRAAVSERP